MSAQEAREKTLRGLGLALLAVWLVNAWLKSERGLVIELLWACYPATLCICMGLFVGRVRLVAVGFVFHAAVGLPAYTMDVIAQGHTTLTSFIVHLGSPVIGGLALRNVPWPRHAVPAAVGMYVALLVASRLFTDPALNVNLAHAPWPPVRDLFPNLWTYWLANLMAMSATLFLMATVVRRFWASDTPATARQRS